MIETMRRRNFLGLLGVAAALRPGLARAQTGKIARIGMLSGGTPAGTKDRDKCLDDGLRELGWIEGQNLAVERRWAEGSVAREPALAEELVRLRPDLIVTSGTPAAQAAQHATRDIPVVFTMVSDPVASGVVSNLARPNGNITGVSNFFPAMISKLFELIVTASGAKRIAVMYDPSNPGKQLDMRYLQELNRLEQRLSEYFEYSENFSAFLGEKIIRLPAVTPQAIGGVLQGKEFSRIAGAASRGRSGTCRRPQCRRGPATPCETPQWREPCAAHNRAIAPHRRSAEPGHP